MIHKFIRKSRQLVNDRELRQWLIRRLTARTRGPMLFKAHRPPYLNEIFSSVKKIDGKSKNFQVIESTRPVDTIHLTLPGLKLILRPDEAEEVFHLYYSDIETLLAMHRFAWLPIYGHSTSSCNWAQFLWNIWQKHFGDNFDNWAWHPYTAAERAINILDLSETHGFPSPIDDTLKSLATHADLIFKRLEYFGEHNTSNHLSNNGRGLYRLGLALNIDWAIEAGAIILEKESNRILGNSGILREGSSHYHLLIARNYIDAWLASRRYSRAEEPIFKNIATRVLAVVPWLVLPGGMPLIGDISPDCPPEYLLGLFGTDTGWIAGLEDDDKSAALKLIDEVSPIEIKQLAEDGWHHFSYGPWTGLWHCAPRGWAESPGHGHQDAGGFELHFNDVALLVDPGRGEYGESHSSVKFRSAEVHNILTISGNGPYPVNKPYYDDTFRYSITGRPPKLTRNRNQVRISHNGFQRFAGIGEYIRQWKFTEKNMRIIDDLQGQGIQPITRRFITPLEPKMVQDGIVLTHYGENFEQSFLLRATNANIAISKTTLWKSYGNGIEGYSISLDTESHLPWFDEVSLEVI